MNIESDPLENIGKTNQSNSQTNHPQSDEDKADILFDDLPAQGPEIGEEESFIDSFEPSELIEEQKKRDNAFKRIFSWLQRKDKEDNNPATKTVIDSRLQSIRGSTEETIKSEVEEETIQPVVTEEENLEEYVPPAPVYPLEEEEPLTEGPSTDLTAPSSSPEPELPEITLEDLDVPAPSISAKPELFIPGEEPHPEAEGQIPPTTTSLEDEWLDLDIDIDKVRAALSQEVEKSKSAVQETEEAETDNKPVKDESIDLSKLREAFLIRSDEKPSPQKKDDYLDTDSWDFDDSPEGKDDNLLKTLEDDFTPATPVETFTEKDLKEAAKVDPNLLNTLDDEWLDLNLSESYGTPRTSDVLFETTGEEEGTGIAEEVGLETEETHREKEFIPDESLFEEVPKEVPATPPRRPNEHYSLLIEMRKGLLDDIDSPVEADVVGPEDAYLEVPEELAAAPAETASEKKRKFRWIWVLIPVGVILLLAAALGIFIALARMNLPTPQPAVVEASGTATENPYESTSIYPEGIMLTGGWYFELNPGVIENGVWKPKSAEWLFGSELRRVIALPWTKQLEAVILSLEPGAKITLAMSNNTILTYNVEKVEKVSKDQTSILSGSTASLVIILYNDFEDDRWVVICTPPAASQ